MSPTEQVARGEVVPGLHGLAPHPLSFAPSLEVRAFLLQRERGNVLIYSSEGLAAETEVIEQLGGVTCRYLNHWHESMFFSEEPRAPLFVHEADHPRLPEELEVRGTFSRRHTLDDDLEVIPTPGHTAGATAYLWDSGSHRVLFTGDTIYLRDGEWVAAVLESSDREAYVSSLELLRELDFDLLAPWAATAGGAPVAATDAADARRRLGTILDRVARGEDG